MTSRLLFTLFISLVGMTSLLAQSDCESTLLRAQEEFDGGRFYSVPEILEGCLEKNQSRNWEQRAYLLLAQTYLLLEEPEKADDSYLKVLRADPEFVTDPAHDPIDLVYLSKKFTATPILSFYGRVGLNTTFIHVLHDVRISPQGNVKEGYTGRMGWQGGAGVQFHYNERISFGGEINYVFSSFRHRSHGMFLEGNYNVDFSERQTWLNVPLLAKYTWPISSFEPYVYGGVFANILLGSKANIVINSNVESPVINVLDMRSGTNHGLLLGGGFRYKWKLRYLFAEVRYLQGMSNVADPAQRYNQINQSWPYVDDDFRLSNLSLNVGYLHPLYKARKLKKARTKSVLRKLERRGDHE